MTPRCTTQLEMFIELWEVKCLESASKGLYKYLTKSYKPVSSCRILPFLGHEFWLLNPLANPPNASAGKSAEWGRAQYTVTFREPGDHQLSAKDG